MFKQSDHCVTKRQKRVRSIQVQILLWVVVLFVSAAVVRTCGSQEGVAALKDSSSAIILTNTAQFRALFGKAYLNECGFRLTGVVTLLDTNRNLLVLQDETGAIGLNCRLQGHDLRVGQRVRLDGVNCHPYVVSFPEYPFNPSGWEIRPSFEAPRDFGDYYLTRMRGYLHPPVTGEYTFWIASDNSSELWLSSNEKPSHSKKIASIARYSWVAPREWNHYPSQRSEPIVLRAGQAYYIEALHEQTTFGDHLAIAWQGPGLKQSVIDGCHLTPWIPPRDRTSITTTNGILREYWTNYSSGNLAVLSGPLSYEAAISVENVRASILGEAPLPKADRIALNQQLSAEDNFRWVEVEGRVMFSGRDGDVACLELSDGQAQVQVRASGWNPKLPRSVDHLPVRVEGVCEGVYDQKGAWIPGLIWATKAECISLIETANTNLSLIMTTALPSRITLANTNPAMEGFYGTRGVVTFNDRVFGEDFLFVQQDSAAVFVSLKDRHFRNQLKVGRWVDLGGRLQPSKSVPTISPLVVTELGWRSMPAPLTQFRASENSDGRWAEVEGVVHVVNSNGTLSVFGNAGRVYLWVGQVASDELAQYVDSKLRVRGVLSQTTLDAPLLLVPSRSFLDVVEPAPPEPFAIPLRSISDLALQATDSSSVHRVRLAGEVIYRDAHSFFVQDASAGIRVQDSDNPGVQVGESVEVVGFPAVNGPFRTLTDALVRSTETVPHAQPRKLDPGEALSPRQSGTLVQVSANLITQKSHGNSHVLELQEHQRVFQATLVDGPVGLPPIAPGSRLQITGVCDNEAIDLPATGGAAVEKAFAGSLNIWLRDASDVVVLKGPPWWTWKRTVTLVGGLLAIWAITLLWVHILRRRLERQQAAQLAFSQQILKRLEDERRRIAGNLHDSLGQILLAIKNQALLAMQRTPEESGLHQRLGEISGATSQAIEEVRQITHGLRPYQLDRLGLTQTIRTTVGHISANSPILFASRVEPIDSLFDKDSEIHIYRIVQEAVNNVVKHSAATEVAVVVKRRPGCVSLSIRDNGKGFDFDQKASAQPHDLGYGLSGIAERVRILGGSLVIDSRPGVGTNLSIEVPLANNTHDSRSNDSDRG